jgi:hypothetical protein
MVPPTTVTEPGQSMAFSPLIMGVLGVLMSRKTRRTMNANASIGTGLKLSIIQTKSLIHLSYLQLI